MSENDYPQGTPNAQVPPQAGAPVPPPATYQVPPQQQAYTQTQPPQQQKVRTNGIGSIEKNRWVAAVLAFVLGSIGIHKFYLGYKSEGMVMLLVAIIGSLCFGIGALVMAIIGLIEAVKYVTLTDADFEQTYLYNYKGWF